MGRFFQPDNPVFRFLGAVFDLILLNALFILTSLPLFTMGASMTALYSALLWRERDDGHTHSIYFQSFKENFRQSTVLWVPCGLACFFLSYELYLVYEVLDPSWRFLQFPVWLSLFFLVSILLYAFPMIARYRQSIGTTVRNSILISLSNFPLTVAVLVVGFVLVDLALHNGDWFVLLLSIYLFIGFALSVKIYSFYLKGVFRKIEEKGAGGKEKNENAEG